MDNLGVLAIAAVVGACFGALMTMEIDERLVDAPAPHVTVINDGCIASLDWTGGAYEIQVAPVPGPLLDIIP